MNLHYSSSEVCCCPEMVHNFNAVAIADYGSPLLQTAHVLVSVTTLGTAEESVLLQRYQVGPLHFVHCGLYRLHALPAAAVTVAVAAAAVLC